MRARPASPALRRLLDMPGVRSLSEAELDGFAAAGLTALFFTGDAARYPEIDDLAIVLPELMKEFPGRFRVGVVDPDGEKRVALRYRVGARPTLLFLREGQVALNLPRLRDWAVYLTEIGRLLATEVT